MNRSAELAILRANIVPMTYDGRRIEAEALAVGADRITAVGSDGEIRSLIDRHTRVLDLSGKSILPGFIDTHVHFVQTGLALRGPDLYDCATVDEVLEVLRREVSGQDHDVPVFAHRCRLAGLDRSLRRWDLDRVAPRNPVGIGDVWLNACVINSQALEVVGLSPEMAGIEVKAGTGKPTGVMTDQAHIVARSYFYDTLDESVRLNALRLASEAALRAGVTTVHAMEGRDAFSDRDVQVLLKQREKLPVRFVLYYQSTNLAKALEAGAQGIADIWADGSYTDRSAALLEPYADDPSTKGDLNFTQDELNDLVWRAHRQGLQVSIHAIGDAAIEQVLRAYQYVQELDAGFEQCHHRIEHFSLPTDAHIDRAKALGVGVAMQPMLSAGPQKIVARRLGPERAKRRHPYRKIVDAGLLVAGGSDSDVTPIDPLAGIHTLVNHSVDSRRLNVMEALSLFTINASRIANEEELKGTIEPGKLADLVVLGDDPLTVNPAKLRDIPVEMTILGGRIVYDAYGTS